jgi:hypothetical protein
MARVSPTDPVVTAGLTTAREVFAAYPSEGYVIIDDGFRPDPIHLLFVRDDPTPGGVLFAGSFESTEAAHSEAESLARRACFDLDPDEPTPEPWSNPE